MISKFIVNSTMGLIVFAVISAMVHSDPELVDRIKDIAYNTSALFDVIRQVFLYD